MLTPVLGHDELKLLIHRGLQESLSVEVLGLGEPAREEIRDKIVSLLKNVGSIDSDRNSLIDELLEEALGLGPIVRVCVSSLDWRGFVHSVDGVAVAQVAADFDADTMTCRGDAESHRMFTRIYLAPFVLPGKM